MLTAVFNKVKAELLGLRAVGLLANGHAGKARDVIQRALRCDPNSAGNLAVMAICQVQLKHYKEALDAANECLRLDGKHTGALLYKGIALEFHGNCEEAIELYERILADKQSPRVFAEQARGRLEVIRSRTKPTGV